MTQPSRREKAEALTAPTSSPTCPTCGVFVVRTHRCTTQIERKRMPADFWDRVEQARIALAAPGEPPAVEAPLPLFEDQDDA